MLRETESKEGYTTRARSETVVSLTKRMESLWTMVSDEMRWL